MKYYGIYVMYPPTVDLRGQGLGRHLAAFLKAGIGSEEYRFVVACPSWTRKSLTELFEDEGLDIEDVEIIGLKKSPVILRLYALILFLLKFIKKKTKNRSPFKELLNTFFNRLKEWNRVVLRFVVSVRNPLLWLIVLPYCGLLFLFMGAKYCVRKLLSLLLSSRDVFVRVLMKLKKTRTGQNLFSFFNEPKKSWNVVSLYQLMMDAEAGVLNKHIQKEDHISAWYSPTAFCSHFNEIKGSRLTCVPDVVLGEFPVGFSLIGGNRLLDNFKEVEKTIKGSDHFVTYSEHLKWDTLVRRYNINPEFVHVVRHGHNSLDDLLPSTDVNKDALLNDGCFELFKKALGKAKYCPSPGPGTELFPYLFYASQFRPSKNVITLLRAYKYLLRELFVGHRMILTGNPFFYDEVLAFVDEHDLSRDVLFLPGLSAKELAACYHYADLAVNPTLFEGGCPFTFTEAVSVGTPVVMGRIPVSEEVITSPELQEMMFFDPFDYKNMANKIKWALENKEALFDEQKRYYSDVQFHRSWRSVVDDYVSILDEISNPSILS